MLLKKINGVGWRYFICVLVYCFYSQAAYAACSGLGCSCSVGTTGVAFGTYNPTLGTADTANGNVAVTCSALVLFTASYVISLGKGASATYSPRFMNLLGVHLNYNLYTTAGFTSIWGDATGGSVTVSDSYTAIALSQTRNYTVFGRIPALQTVGAGTYIDSVTVTVTY
ncbi:putative secreted pili protein [Candidatus Rickettsiella viridis]|uniref:Putative secreted pili protein n=1 Tax=Candidatus Rickettsiella viridis TaxID=676208 RepID=A0A2Z5UTU2_9COXI|nr:spore coat U domain-containing protein [Candidatus Rickettsiella viridis]BBB14878.1 putative secreted pili protein [Candidatus Rickettsiella viridis]